MKYIRDIGEGGFGVVKLVEDANGTLLAKKELALDKVPDDFKEQALRRFKREVGYQSEIHHPNVVSILAFDLTENPPWFTMPLAECSLQDLVLNDRALGGNYKEPLLDILAGLEAIHENKCCHRDLKPANVLCFSENGRFRFAISDFGLISNKERKTTQITSTGMQAGTEAYSAPECYIDFKNSNHLADIYSFGAILYDIFADDPARIPYTELTSPGDIGPVIERCTKKEQARRFQSIEELRKALLNALDGFSSQEHTDLNAIQLVISRHANDEDASPNEWQAALRALGTNSDDDLAHSVLSSLRLSEIDSIAQYPGVLAILADAYSNFIQTRGFSFDVCDPLADKAKRIYDFGSDTDKAKITIATLELGVSHNRWYVEGVFVQMASPSITVGLAQRILNISAEQEYDFPKNALKALDSIDKPSTSIHKMLLGDA